MRVRGRWALSLVDAALSKADQVTLPRLARALARLRDRAARSRLRPLTVLVVVLLVGASAVAVATLLRPEPPRSGGSSPLWLGVHDGDSIPAYIDLSRLKLEELAAREPDRVVYALVSLRRYLSPDEVAAVVGEVAGVLAYARVPLPGRQTERVRLDAIRIPADLASAMDRVAVRKEEDADRYTALADQQPAGTLRDIYTSNADLSREEAAAYRQRCACVFAIVVRGSAAALLTLARSPDVRAVEPAPDLANASQAVFAPPLPEQVDRATPLPDDGLPVATP